jgi:hypothetical protein
MTNEAHRQVSLLLRMIMDRYYIGDLARPAVMWMRINPVPLESSPTESVSAAVNAIVALNSPQTDKEDVVRQREDVRNAIDLARQSPDGRATVIIDR